MPGKRVADPSAKIRAARIDKWLSDDYKTHDKAMQKMNKVAKGRDLPQVESLFDRFWIGRRKRLHLTRKSTRTKSQGLTRRRMEKRPSYRQSGEKPSQSPTSVYFELFLHEITPHIEDLDEKFGKYPMNEVDSREIDPDKEIDEIWTKTTKHYTHANGRTISAEVSRMIDAISKTEDRARKSGDENEPS